jgi:hypothetical protein
MKLKLWMMTLVLLATSVLAVAQQTRKQRQTAMKARLSAGALPVGTTAPDLTLPKLKTTKTADGKLAWSASKETVTLSDTIGKKIIVIFSSSYT